MFDLTTFSGSELRTVGAATERGWQKLFVFEERGLTEEVERGRVVRAMWYAGVDVDLAW